MANQTNHYKYKRYKREKFINKHLYGDGNVVDSFVVDRGHPMGEEVHCITDHAVIVILNKNSGKLCTKLLARKNQIKRLYQGVGRQPPRWLLKLAMEHERLGYNKI